MGLISFGKITKAHGLKGEVKLLPHSRSLHSFEEITKIFVEITASHTPEAFEIDKLRFHKNTAVLKLNGIDTIEEAERLRGRAVYIDDKELGKLEEDEYYFSDLIGLEAYTVDGEYLGKVEEVMERAIQSLLVIKNDDKELLVPLSEPIVKEVNIDTGKIIISPVKGMFD